MKLTIAACALVVQFISMTALAAGKQETCAADTYENQNQIDPPALTVQAIHGIVTDHQGVAIPKACVAIFTEKNHKLIVTTYTDPDGRFTLHNIPPGQYRLVTKYDFFCPANIRLHVVSRRKNKRELHVHMQTPAVDSCSYVDLKTGSGAAKNLGSPSRPAGCKPR